MKNPGQLITYKISLYVVTNVTTYFNLKKGIVDGKEPFVFVGRDRNGVEIYSIGVTALCLAFVQSFLVQPMLSNTASLDPLSTCRCANWSVR